LRVDYADTCHNSEYAGDDTSLHQDFPFVVCTRAVFRGVHNAFQMSQTGRQPAAFQLGGKSGRRARAGIALMSSSGDWLIVDPRNLRGLNDRWLRRCFKLRRGE